MSSAAAPAQTVDLHTLPQVQHTHQHKRDSLVRRMRMPFEGGANVVPENERDSSVSIGLAGVPPVRGHFCAGTILGPRWVLTAAHCASSATAGNGAWRVAPIDPAALQVLDRTRVLYNPGRIVRIARIILHPRYRITPRGIPENDVALLQTAENMEEKAATLASDAIAAQVLRPGEKIRIAGWGTASFSPDSPISPILLFAHVDVIDRDRCNEAYGGVVTADMFCAGLGSADACQGDSGGGAYGYDEHGEPVLLGIVSWGAGCAEKKYPGVYVNVIRYRSWIDETVRKSAAIATQ